MEKTADRIKTLEKIAERERKGQFDFDVEDDPETIPLKPGDIDYLREKTSSKIKTYFVNLFAKKYIELRTQMDEVKKDRHSDYHSIVEF